MKYDPLAIAQYCRSIFVRNPALYAAAGTIQFHEITEANTVGKVAASGILTTIKNSTFVITALHAALTESIGILALARDGKTSVLTKAGKYPVFLSKKLSRDGGRGDPIVDLTVFRVDKDIEPIRYTSQFGLLRIQQPPLFQCEPSDDDDERFCCAGAIPWNEKESRTTSLFCFLEGLTYFKKDSEYVYFNLPERYCNLDYAGLSGAPIYDANGVPVAILCGKCDEDEKGTKISPKIYGITVKSVLKMIHCESDSSIKKYSDMTDVARQDIVCKIMDIDSAFYDSCKDVIFPAK